MTSLLMFPRVRSRCTLSLSIRQTSVNVHLLSEVNSIHIFCSSITHLISGTFAKSFICYFEFVERHWFRNIPSSTTPSFTVDLPQTVCRSVQCLNAEKMAPFVNIFDVSFPFCINWDIVERLSLYFMSAVLPIARD